MAKKFKYGKLAVVIFITVLIWVWADLALDEVLPDKPAVIVVDEPANPKLWVNFNQVSAADFRITLSGPHSIIAEERRQLKEGKILEFDFDASQENMDEPGRYTLTLLPFLQKNNQIKQRGLKVVSCEPEKITVDVTGLVKKSLTVQCVDEDQNPVKTETIEPAQVDMFVPSDWGGEKLAAKVRLTRAEIDQARLSPVEKLPYIELTPEKIKEAPTTAKITTPPEQDLLRPETIKNATLGFNLSATLQGKIKVQVINLSEVLSAIAIRATPEAKLAYENMRYQVILEIDDSDKGNTPTEPLRKELIYNFSPEYVRKNEIMLNQQPVIARFKLIPVPADQTAAGPAE